MNSIEKLVAADPATLDPKALQLHPAEIASLKALAEEEIGRVMTTHAAPRATVHKQTFAGWLSDAAANLADPRLSWPDERAREVRDQARVLLAAIAHFRAFSKAAVPGTGPRQWPNLPARPLREPPCPVRRDPAAVDIAAWCKAREGALLDAARVRVVDGRLLVRGFSAEDRQVLASNERTVIAWIAAQFEPAYDELGDLAASMARVTPLNMPAEV